MGPNLPSRVTSRSPGSARSTTHSNRISSTSNAWSCAKLELHDAPDALSIDRVRVVKPFDRVIVSSDADPRTSRPCSIRAGTAATAEASRGGGSRTKARRGLRKKTRAEIRAEKKAAAAAAKARAQAPPSPAPEAARRRACRSASASCASRAARMDFADYSIQPNFAAAIQALDGSVTGLSSDPNARAKVDLEGNVGEFSPVQHRGHGAAVRVRPAHGHRLEVRKHFAAGVQSLLGQVRGLQHREGQAHDRSALHDRRPQAPSASTTSASTSSNGARRPRKKAKPRCPSSSRPRC